MALAGCYFAVSGRGSLDPGHMDAGLLEWPPKAMKNQHLPLKTENDNQKSTLPHENEKMGPPTPPSSYLNTPVPI